MSTFSQTKCDFCSETLTPERERLRIMLARYPNEGASSTTEINLKDSCVGCAEKMTVVDVAVHLQTRIRSEIRSEEEIEASAEAERLADTDRKQALSTLQAKSATPPSEIVHAESVGERRTLCSYSQIPYSSTGKIEKVTCASCLRRHIEYLVDQAKKREKYEAGIKAGAGILEKALNRNAEEMRIATIDACAQAVGAYGDELWARGDKLESTAVHGARMRVTDLKERGT